MYLRLIWQSVVLIALIFLGPVAFAVVDCNGSKVYVWTCGPATWTPCEAMSGDSCPWDACCEPIAACVKGDYPETYGKSCNDYSGSTTIERYTDWCAKNDDPTKTVNCVKKKGCERTTLEGAPCNSPILCSTSITNDYYIAVECNPVDNPNYKGA